MDLTQDMAVHMGMRVSPRLVAASYILELSSMELQQAISAELADNPAMEMLEQPTCPTCGEPLHGSICPNCLNAQKGPTSSSDGDYDSSDDYVPEHSLSGSADDEFDPLTQVAVQLTLSERLNNELQAMLPREDVPIGEYLVGNLNDNGYLQTTVEEVSERLHVSTERVELVLKALQSLEPVGIGARNLRECLLIQLDYLTEEGIEVPPCTREIIEDHLQELAEHKYSRIAAELGVSTEVVSEAGQFIRQQLNPFPARGHSSSEPGSSEGKSAYLLPDVIVNYKQGRGPASARPGGQESTGQENGYGPARRQGDYLDGHANGYQDRSPNGALTVNGLSVHSADEDGNEFEVDVVESKRFYLRVTPLYQRLAADLEREPGRYTDDEKRHIKEYVSRAKLFIANINQRRQTLQKITEFIVEAQKDFLRHGIRALKPLTRATVAAQLGMHESTVSRATANKYVMLPNRRVIPFSDFFTASLSVMDVIKELIEHETTPMTDQEIANELAKRGIPIARRTVAKYREQLNILPSSLR